MGYRKYIAERASGQVPLVVGEATGTVTDDFEAVPTRIYLTVQGPEDADVITANYVGGTASETGFDYQLSAAPQTEGYTLNYLCDF